MQKTYQNNATNHTLLQNFIYVSPRVPQSQRSIQTATQLQVYLSLHLLFLLSLLYSGLVAFFAVNKEKMCTVRYI